jgi:hypothetical protein
MNKKGLASLRAWCRFDKPATCYILQIIARKKENATQTEKEKLKAQARRICVNEEELESSYDELAEVANNMAEKFGLTYRMYVSINKRDMQKGLRSLINHELDLLLSKNDETIPISRISSKWKSLLSKDNCRADKYWMLDVDFNEMYAGGLTELVQKLRTAGVTVVFRQYTPNGMAWIIEPFNPNLVELPAGVSLCKDHLMFVEMFEPKKEK